MFGPVTCISLSHLMAKINNSVPITKYLKRKKAEYAATPPNREPYLWAYGAKRCDLWNEYEGESEIFAGRITFCMLLEKSYLRIQNVKSKMAREKKNLPTVVPPYRIGLALSGGGAKGFAHVGVLKALEELDIRPDIISGTSAGAIIAVLYADGYSPDEILDLFSGLSFNDLAEITLPRAAFFKIDRFWQFLRRSLRSTHIEELSIPVVVTATDLDHGKPVVWRSGSIVERVAASCSIPIIFPPVVIDGIHYVDGGVLRNLPVFPIRPECDVVIGINVSPLVDKQYKQSILDIAVRSYSFMSKSNVVEDMKMCDVFIPMKEAARYAVFDIHALRDIANVGYQQTLKLFADKNSVKRNELNK